jgi:hypothetical protein
MVKINKFTKEELETFTLMLQEKDDYYRKQIEKAKQVCLRIMNISDKEFLKSQIAYYENELINLKNIQLKITKGGLLK